MHKPTEILEIKSFALQMAFEVRQVVSFNFLRILQVAKKISTEVLKEDPACGQRPGMATVKVTFEFENSEAIMTCTMTNQGEWLPKEVLVEFAGEEWHVSLIKNECGILRTRASGPVGVVSIHQFKV